MCEKTYVKTVYDAQSYREPDITGYDTKEKAEGFVKTCLEWGMGIVSCKIIDDPNINKGGMK